MSWLCKPGCDGPDDPDDPGWTREHSSHRFVWQEDDEVSGLEVRRRSTKGENANECKGMVTRWVALWLLGVLWLIESGMLSFPLLLFIHVPVADSGIISPDERRRVTARGKGGKKKRKIGQKNISAHVRLWNSETRSYQRYWTQGSRVQEQAESDQRTQAERSQHFFSLYWRISQRITSNPPENSEMHHLLKSCKTKWFTKKYIHVVV